MRLISIDDTDKVCRNGYEAVLIAAQYARKLNAIRLNKERNEEIDMEEGSKQYLRVTSQALYDLVDGKLKFERSWE